MTDSPPRPIVLRGWLGVVSVAVILLILAVTLVWWWYESTADLQAVRSEAKALGIPCTWAETGLVVAPADEIAAYELIGQLAKRLKDYDSEAAGGRAGAGARLRTYHPIPAAAFEYHSNMDPVLLAEFLALIDRLPAHPLIVRGERTVPTLVAGTLGERETSRILGERVLLSPRERLPTEVRRLLHFTSSRDLRALVEIYIHISCVTIAADRIAGRFAEVKSDMPDLADLLDHLADQLEVSLIAALAGEFLVVNDSVTHVDEIQKLMSSSRSYWDRVHMNFTIRAGRQSMLRHLIDWVELARRRLPPSDLVAAAARIRRESEQLRWWIPTEYQLRMLMWSMPMALEMLVTCQMRLRVMAAELRNAPWPIDPFDPTGMPLRRFERDGRMIGAYTVYENRVDDGGDKKKDRYFPLYGPLEPPVRAGP